MTLTLTATAKAVTEPPRGLSFSAARPPAPPPVGISGRCAARQGI